MTAIVTKDDEVGALFAFYDEARASVPARSFPDRVI